MGTGGRRPEADRLRTNGRILVGLHRTSISSVCTREALSLGAVTCNEALVIHKLKAINQSGGFRSLDCFSITHQGKKIMSNDQNKAFVDESSFAFCAERTAKTFDRRQFVIAGAGGIAAFLAAPSYAFASQNPVINQNGTASISSGQYCTWNTANGRNSTLTVANPSRANNLVIAIMGAPASGIMIQVGNQVQQTLNSIFTLPPNSATFIIMATGNFGGARVTISNITNKQNDAQATIQVVA